MLSAAKKRQKIVQKRSIQKHLIILAATDRQKRENTTSLNDFGEGRAPG